MSAGCTKAHARLAVGLHVEVDRGFQVGFLDPANVAERIPVHLERLGLVRL